MKNSLNTVSNFFRTFKKAIQRNQTLLWFIALLLIFVLNISIWMAFFEAYSKQIAYYIAWFCVGILSIAVLSCIIDTILEVKRIRRCDRNQQIVLDKKQKLANQINSLNIFDEIPFHNYSYLDTHIKIIPLHLNSHLVGELNIARLIPEWQKQGALDFFQELGPTSWLFDSFVHSLDDLKYQISELSLEDIVIWKLKLNEDLQRPKGLHISS